MPSLIGHSLIGYIIYRGSTRSVAGRRWRLIPLYLLAANAADLDFLPGLLMGDPNRYHHGVSHSIGFAVLFALVFSPVLFILKRDIAWWRHNFAILFCLYCSHIGLDYFASDGSFPYGAPVFWPVSSEYYIAPIALFRDIRRSSLAIEFFRSLFSLHNFWAVSVEVLVLLPFVWLILWRRAGGGVCRPAAKLPTLRRLLNKISLQGAGGSAAPLSDSKAPE